MSMKTTDRILGEDRATVVETLAWATKQGAARLDFLGDYLREVARLSKTAAMPDAAIAFSQSVHETSEAGRPWNSYWYRTRGNVAGIGITGDPQQNQQSPVFETGEEAACAQISHLLLYATGEIRRGGLTPDDDPRYAAYRDAYGTRAMAQTINGLAGTWATDPQYATKLIARSVQMYGAVPDQDTGDETPPHATPDRPFVTGIPGLPGGALVTFYPIRMNLIAVDGYQRTGQKAHTPRRSVQHGTGNASNPSAWQEAQYFVNGAGGSQASIHACADDREVVICTPLDEITWQAADGGGPGNMNGYSCEMMEADAIWHAPNRRDALISITADFMGRCAARLGVTTPERHYDFNENNAPSQRHYCPNKLLTTTIDGRKAWDIYAAKWHAARRDELAPDAPEKPVKPVKPTPPKPPTLPPGMSGSLADALYNPDKVEHPDGGVPDYREGQPPSDAWCGYCLANNPDGKVWTDYPWPGLSSIIRRGDGRTVWAWSDGFVFEEAAPE